jgi:AraC-like DNA-binding protein
MTKTANNKISAAMPAPEFKQSQDCNDENAEGETVRWIRAAALPNVELMVGEHSARRWRVYHENYVVVPIKSADADYRYRGKLHPLASNDCALMEPGESHVNTAVRAPADFTAIFLSPRTVSEAALELGGLATPHFRVPKNNNPVFLRALREFQAAVERGSGVLELQSRLAVWVRYMIEQSMEIPPRRYREVANISALARVKACLSERYADSVSLNELAQLTGVFRFHLLRTFTHRYGLPPHAFQIAVRVERAKSLLGADVSLSDTSSLVGFSDQSHFTRHFKRVCGITPGQYVRALG